MYHVRSYFNEFLYRYFKNKELDELYASVGIKSFAISLIGIFIPIYLLTLGFNLIDVGIYYLIYYLAILVFYPPSLFLGASWGIKKTMALGIIAILGYFAALNAVGSGSPYYIAALIQGLGTSLYWTSYHIDFTKFFDKEKIGTEISILRILTLGATALGPAIGAFFISSKSFSFLFLIVSIILIFAIFPLFFTEDAKTQRPRLSIFKVLKYGGKKMAIGHQAAGFLGFVSGILWPIFMFFALKDVFSLGFIVSATSVITVFLLLMMGRFTDKGSDKALGIGTILDSLSWISRMFFLSPIGIFINNFYASITRSMVVIPFEKKVYRRAHGSENVAEFVMFREFHLFLGRMVAIALFLAIGSITSMFISASIVTLMHLLLVKQRKG